MAVNLARDIVSVIVRPMATTDNDDDDENAGQGKRDRSPNYPAITFTDALEKARKIWEAEKRHPVSSEIAVQHMEYKRLNGASTPVLGALKRYGLLTPSGKKEVRISDDAHFIFVHPDGDPERDAMIRKLAMMPSLFGEILSRYPDGLPSDANLRAKLQMDWKFASQAAADAVIKALREAVRIRDAGVARSGSAGEDSGEFTKESPVTPPTPQAIKQPIATPTATPSAYPTQSRPWDLGSGVIMTVVLPTKLSKKNIDKLKRYVAALENEAAIAWDDEPSVEEQS